MSLIPLPKEILQSGGYFELTEKTALNCDERLLKGGKIFSEFFQNKFGTPPKDGKGVSFVFDENLADEEYTLIVNSEKVQIKANNGRGAVCAFQTLRQWGGFDLSEKEYIEIPCAQIRDKPRFNWRGVSFDVSRYFFGAEEIERFLELMSLFKLNVLHLHLCDDQGFRIEISKYPELNKIASFRDGTRVRDGISRINRGRYGGYYTKKQIREIVGRAAELNITVVPEIDLPGHTSAIVAAMPELSCRGEKIPVRTEFGISTDILCAGNPKTYEVVKDILDEICELFPSGYVHLGGDEAPKQNWKTCEKCQEKIKKEKLKDEEALQGYFFNYFAEYLSNKGKKVIGWNECLVDTLDKKIICQHWTPKTAGKNKITVDHVNGGRKVIVSDFLKTYFDYPYAMTSIKKVFGFDPFTTLRGISKENAANVLGAECNVWTEWIPDREKLDFNVFPRILAFAENVWRDEKVTYDDFVKRMKEFYPVLDALKVGYARNKENPTAPLKALNIIRKQFTCDAYAELNEQKQTEKNI